MAGSVGIKRFYDAVKFCCKAPPPCIIIKKVMNSKNRDKNNGAVSFPVYILKAAGCCAGAFALATLFASHGTWAIPVTVIALSLPVAIGGIYRSIIRKIRFLTVFSRRGFLAALLSGRILAILLWTIYAVLSSFFLLIGFQFFTATDFGLLILVIPVFYIVYRAFYHFFEKELQTYLVTSMALSGAVFCTPFFMLAICAAAIHGFELPFAPYKTLEAAIAAHENAVSGMTGSALVQTISQWMAVYAGMKAYAAGHAGQSGLALSSVASLFLAGYILFFNAVNILTFCLVPARELKRILLPLSPDPPLTHSKTLLRNGAFYALAVTAFLVSLVAGFFFLESRVSGNAEFTAHSAAARQTVIRYAELIDNVYVAPGTITTIEAHKMDLLRDLDGAARELEVSIDRAFDDMVYRVDDFLDWYYSLPAEYVRIAHMISGSAEDHLSAMLSKHLDADENFAAVHGQVDLLLSRHEDEKRRLHDAAQRLVAKNRIHDPAEANDPRETIEVVKAHRMADLLDYEDAIGIDFRMLSASASSGGGFLAGGMIGKKIAANVAKKSVFKASARTAARFGGSKVAGKSGGGAAGAAAGAAAGSILPGGGTVIGAVIGGITGSVAGALLMDKTLLLAEERYSRADFKAEIVDAIEQSRRETKAQLYGR